MQDLTVLSPHWSRSEILAAAKQEKWKRTQNPIVQFPTWTPLEWQKKPLEDRSLILLLTGSKGGGKSHLAAYKVHEFVCAIRE
jgi:pantothenate kinase-related protein Tda10